MRLQRTLLAVLVAAALCAPAMAANVVDDVVHDHSSAELASMQLENDPYAKVYIVSSNATFQGISSIARNGVARRDSIGTALVVSEIQAHQLSRISESIHQREKRCGGYFAFSSRADADAFIRNDQSAVATQRSLLASYTIDNQATVGPWLPLVSETNIYNTINHLQGYTNRYYTSASGKQAAEWIRDTWQGLAGARTDVSTALWTSCGNCSTQPSVIMTVQGTDLPNEVIVIGGHLDSISGSGSATGVAPGADDDASGIATITEIIRISLASGWKPKRTVKFMAYAAEEVGLRGSKSIADKFKLDGVNVVGVLQLDMTNYKTGTPEDMQLVTDFSNADLKTFFNSLFDEYLAPLGLIRGTITCGYACSDHGSWTSAGFPAAMMFEAGNDAGKNTSAFNGTYNPKIHTTTDNLQNMGESASPSVPFAKFGLAFLGELGKTSSGGGNTPPVANFSSTVNGLTVQFTDSSTDSNGTIASRSWNFGDGTSSTTTSPSKTYSAAGTYTVTLTVTDNQGATNTRTASVTVTAAPSGGVLTNGQAVTVSGASKSNTYYTLVVPAGATNLKFVTAGGTGDADLYVKFGSQPTSAVADCKSEGSTSAETCNIAVAQAGTYHVLVHAYSAISGVSLTGSYGTGGGGTQTYTNAADVVIGDNTTVESPITVSGRTGNAPSNASLSVNILHTYQGDLKVDLVAPDGTLYNIHNRSGGSADNVIKTATLNLSSEALNGTWKLRANDNAANDTGKIDSWSVTF